MRKVINISQSFFSEILNFSQTLLLAVDDPLEKSKSSRLSPRDLAEDSLILLYSGLVFTNLTSSSLMRLLLYGEGSSPRVFARNSGSL